MIDTEHECPSCGAVTTIEVVSGGDEGDNILFCPICGSELEEEEFDDELWDDSSDEDDED